MLITLFGCIGVISLLFIIAGFMPSKYFVEAIIVIEKPIETVMEKIANLNHYRSWNPWQRKDPNAVYKIFGEPLTKGHQYTWEGRKVGKGSLILREIDFPTAVHFDLIFEKPWSSTATDDWHLEHFGENGTKVIWQNHGQLPWPWGRLFGGMLKRQLNRQFKEGIQFLKTYTENEK